MKRAAFAVGLVVLVFMVSTWAQTAAPKPGPEHQKVAVFIGHWTYEGEYKAGPLTGGKFKGEYNAQMILGGFFVQGQWVENGPGGEVKGFETFGYDSANKNYAQSQYQDDGSVGAGVFIVNGNTWNYLGKMDAGGNEYRWRMAIVFAADLMSYALKGDISMDGSTWTPLYEAKYIKATPAPKK